MNTNDKHNAEQQNTQKETRIMPGSSFELRKGGNFYFDVNGCQVRVWFASFSGKQEVYVEDTLVSSSRSWRKMVTHNFEVAGQPYKLLVGIHNWSDASKGFYLAELYHNEKLIDKDEILMFEDARNGAPFSWRKFAIGIAPWLIGGFIFGFFTTKFIFSLFS
ncbi:hypothetical protein A28LD_0582 [Idiomarina sp. A28L]|nr:hypothetical protein A28LD_0582 [Idiomarina sp. A28L]